MVLNHFFICMLVAAVSFFTHLQGNIRMGISTASNYVGDREVAWRMKIAGEMLGWTVILDENEGREIQNQSDLDFVICMLPNNEFLNPHCPNYQMIFHPFWYLDEQRRLVPFYEKYDGYLLTISERESIEEALSLKNKKFNYIPFYPSVYSVPYQESPLTDVFTTIPVWSNRLTDQKFRSLYASLSQTGFVKFYGVHRNEDIINEGYMGKIPFDGVSVIGILQQHGIVLVLHSDIHNEEAIPSARIFEAAAASTVIISDENPFVKKHFGDSVFYIDTTVSADEIFNQIQGHLKTIYLDSANAREMAKRAHQIFMDNFEMTKQLLELEALNQKIIGEKVF